MKDCFYLKLYNLIHLLIFLNSEAFWLNHSKNSNHLPDMPDCLSQIILRRV